MKWYLFGTPLLVLIEVLLINAIFSLISEPSDISVLIGIVSFCLFLIGNYFLIITIKNKIKK